MTLSRAILLSLSLSVPIGCQRMSPPETLPNAPVEGRVHISDRPISSGWIEFLPVDGARGHLRSAPIAADGTFRLTGVAVGTNAVRLVHAGPSELRRPIYGLPIGAFEQFTSPIRLLVSSTRMNRVDIDLAREALRHRNSPGLR